MITSEMIKKELEEKLSGKDCGYDPGYYVGRVLRSYISAQGHEKLSYSLDISTDHNNVALVINNPYKKASLNSGYVPVRVIFHKKKVADATYRESAKYNFSSFEVTITDNHKTFEESINSIKAHLKEDRNVHDTKIDRTVEIYKTLMEKYNISDFEVRDLLKFAYDQYYNAIYTQLKK